MTPNPNLSPCIGCAKSDYERVRAFGGQTVFPHTCDGKRRLAVKTAYTCLDRRGTITTLQQLNERG